MKTKKTITKKQVKKPAAAKKAEKKASKEAVVKIYNAKGKEVDAFKLDEKLFTGEVHKGSLYQAIRMYNANKRQGNASTKTRGDVSGGGKKPFRQKGTGRARMGSIRSPLWPGGGIVFGPHPRDYGYAIPKKIKDLAFVSSINSKMDQNHLIGIDSIVIAEPKTKHFQAIVDALKLKGKSLFVLDTIDRNVRMASRNIEGVEVKNYKEFNALDVMKCDNLVMSKSALTKLSERVK